MYIADQVFPVVSVQKKSDVYFTFDKNSWLRSNTEPRAPGTRASRADYSITTASYVCISDAIAKGVPIEVQRNADAPLRPLVTATNFVTDQLLLGLEIRVADLVTASGNWASASNPTTKWSSSLATPIDDIDTAVNAVVSTIGRMPNVAAMSWDVWRNLKKHTTIRELVKYTRDGAEITTTDFATWFGFDKVLVGTSIKDTGAEGATAAISYVWGDAFWCGYVPAAAALEEPAAGYTFQWGNRVISRYEEDQEKQSVVEGEHYTAEVISASDAGACLGDVV
jgi:hypothetical protein